MELTTKGDAMITKTQALALLKNHGWEPWDPTAWWPETGLQDVTSSFYATFGNHETYNVKSIYHWLGY
jgi:hypothetical protein